MTTCSRCVELEAVLAEVDRLLATEFEDGGGNPAGACFRIRRVLDDEAPAGFRVPVDAYRNGKALA